MQKLKTPSEWTTKTLVYPKITVGDDYNFDRAVYSDVPSARLDLCWQPVDDGSTAQERGEVSTASYTAVVYDAKIRLNKGDMVKIDGLGYFLITSVKKYISHRHITVRSTDRRVQNVKN